MKSKDFISEIIPVFVIIALQYEIMYSIPIYHWIYNTYKFNGFTTR